MHILTYNITKSGPLSPTVIVNVKQLTVSEVFFLFPWWPERMFGNTVLNHHMHTYILYATSLF